MLQIEDQAPRQVDRATFGLTIVTERVGVIGRSFFGKPKLSRLYGLEHAHAFWDIEIVVDGHSGEDCAAAPTLRAPVDGRAFPATLELLTGMRLTEDDMRGAEAWFGNDAPVLQRNTLEFGDWLPDGRLMLRWSAEYDWGVRAPKRLPFLFEGPVEFVGIIMKVKRDDDAPSFLQRVLPAFNPLALTLSHSQAVDPDVAAKWKIELTRLATWKPTHR